MIYRTAAEGHHGVLGSVDDKDRDGPLRFEITLCHGLGDPSLTTFARRELRNQMKQCSEDLKVYLQRAEAQPPPARDSDRSFARPELRILA